MFYSVAVLNVGMPNHIIFLFLFFAGGGGGRHVLCGDI